MNYVLVSCLVPMVKRTVSLRGKPIQHRLPWIFTWTCTLDANWLACPNHYISTKHQKPVFVEKSV